jgi:hypothetical protein
MVTEQGKWLDGKDILFEHICETQPYNPSQKCGPGFRAPPDGRMSILSPATAGQRRHGHLDPFFRWVLIKQDACNIIVEHKDHQ